MTQPVAKPMAKWMVPGLLGVLIIAIAGVAAFQYTQTSSLSNQVSNLQSQVNTLQNQTSHLQTTVNNYQSLLNLTVTTTWVNSQSFAVANGKTIQLGNFTAGYAGYIHVVAALNQTNCCDLKMTDSFFVGGLPSYYFFQGMQSTTDIPVLPGTIGLSFIDQGAAPVSITIKIVYYS